MNANVTTINYRPNGVHNFFLQYNLSIEMFSKVYIKWCQKDVVNLKFEIRIIKKN